MQVPAFVIFSVFNASRAAASDTGELVGVVCEELRGNFLVEGFKIRHIESAEEFVLTQKEMEDFLAQEL